MSEIKATKNFYFETIWVFGVNGYFYIKAPQEKLIKSNNKVNIIFTRWGKVPYEFKLSFKMKKSGEIPFYILYHTISQKLKAKSFVLKQFVDMEGAISWIEEQN